MLLKMYGIDKVSSLIENEELYSAMSNANNPYGDGQACKRITDMLK